MEIIYSFSSTLTHSSYSSPLIFLQVIVQCSHHLRISLQYILLLGVVVL
jgi:hypothetical protein